MMLESGIDPDSGVGGLDTLNRFGGTRAGLEPATWRSSSPRFLSRTISTWMVKAVFILATTKLGVKQGGNPFGKYPPLDDNFYFITAVYHHWKLTGNTALWKSKVKTSSGSMKLADLCERVYRMVASDAATGLCIAGNVETENAKDFGFCGPRIKKWQTSFSIFDSEICGC